MTFLRKYHLSFILVLLVIAGSDTLTELVYKNPYYAKVIFLASSCFLLLPIHLLRNHLKWYLFYLMIPFLLLVGKYFSYFIFDIPFEDQTILMVINTSLFETGELFKNYLGETILFILIYSVGFASLFYYRPKQFSFDFTKLASLFSLALLLIMPAIFPYSKWGDGYLENLKKEIVSSYPGNFIKLSRDIINQYYLVYATKSVRDNYKYSPVQNSVEDDEQIHVIIIGESARYENWGINGYYRNTSPLLSKRDHLISFSNVTAEGYITELSVPLIITGVEPDSYKTHFKQKSIVGLFNELGFATYWLSNQYDRGSVTAHANEASKKYFIMSQEHDGVVTNISDNRDMMLVQHLKTVLNEPSKNKFIVIHTLGSHFDYSMRYPDAFDVYKPSYKTVHAQPNDPKHKDALINSYDNSILYADAVVDSIISLVAAKNAFSVVSYISDHGENLMDDKRNLCYHATPIPTNWVAHIPFFVWYSPKLATKYPEKIANLNSNKSVAFATSNFMNTITELLGISSAKIDSSQSISNKYFKPRPRYILGSDHLYNIDSLNK